MEATAREETSRHEECDSVSSESTSVSSLTPAQLERIEKNRQRALALRRSRVPIQKSQMAPTESRTQQLPEDTHGGFFLEEESDEDQPLKKRRPVQDEAPAFGEEMMECEECFKRFAESFLWSHFRCCVCNECRDSEGSHSLITKTEAKERFLLKDCDFEERGGPPLLYILRKNPHSSRGEMKLYMISQVMSRSHALWGGEEGLEKERTRRNEAKEKRKQKQYSKQVKELRKTVYSSGSSLTKSRSHCHAYSQEQYNPDDDSWTKTCEECGHSVTFEKL